MTQLFKTNLIRIGKTLLITLAVVLGVFLIFKASFYLAPFIIAFIISQMVEPLIQLLVKRARIPRKPAAAFSVLLVLSTLGFLLFLLISKLISEFMSLYNFLDKSSEQISNYFTSLIGQASDIYHWLPKEVSDNVQGLAANFSSSLVKILSTFAKGVVSTAISLPQILVFILVTLLSTYFIASDREKILKFFSTQLPESWVRKIRSIKNDLFSALLGYIRAQLILMSITFTELSIGFFIIHLKYFLLLALAISIIDALPILGTGGILIPWCIFEFVTRDYGAGLSLLIIYLVVLVVRQMIEPKILSQQIGVHPLLTLIAMYTGLQLIGVGGLILGPITVLLLRNILSGIFKGRSFSEVFFKPKNFEK